VVVAKTRQAMVRLTGIFTAGEAEKTYLALAKGRFSARAAPSICASPSTSRRPLPAAARGESAVGRDALEEARRRAGSHAARADHRDRRTHQIGVTWRPSDTRGRRYPPRRLPLHRIAQRQWGLRRMFLHSAHLALPHPLTKKRLSLTSRLPLDLAMLAAGRHPVETQGS